MVVNRQRKVAKYRGHSNHGGGMRKKRRGAGSRGGRGMAGTGKRAGQKKAGMAPMLGRLGSKGFLPRRAVMKITPINVAYFTPICITRLVAKGKATQVGAVVEINLGVLGYGALLGTGSVKQKLKLHVARASPKAIEKIKAAGGEVIVE